MSPLWKQDHPVYLWRYIGNPRNYPGWHFRAEEAACSELLKLLDLIVARKLPRPKVVEITPPTRHSLEVVGNRDGMNAWKSAKALSIIFSEDGFPDDYWSLAAVEGNVVLTLGKGRISDLRDGIEAMSRGEGDFAIGPEDAKRFDQECLWFWW